MSVNIKIHRSTDQIGGVVTEIYTENTHIFIDFGAELPGSEGKFTDDEMVQMIRKAECDGILFTHHHGDHIGLLKEIPQKDIRNHPIRLALGETARQIMINIHKTLAGSPSVPTEQVGHKEILHILEDDSRWEDLHDGDAFYLGDFKIMPIRADHSSYDSFLFLIEAQGFCILHTGDFRTHGRLGKRFFRRLSNCLKGKQVNVLLMEGTMMSRLSEKMITEEELEHRAYEVLKKEQNRYAFLVCSSTNVESLASFHNAALRLGRPFIVNHYVYEQLLLYRETAGKENTKLSFWKAYPFENMDVYNKKLGMTQPEYMKKHGFVMMVGANESYTRRMEYFRQENPQNDPLLIYSMWSGYLDEKGDAYNPKLKALYDRWPRHLQLHTSGHAYREDIEEMIRLVHPTDAIIPIHTEEKEKFCHLAIGELQELVHPLSDGGVFYHYGNDVLNINKILQGGDLRAI